MKKIILWIVVAIFGAGLFALTACGDKQSPQGEDLKDYVYNEAGGFYEQEVDDAISVSFLPAISSMYFYRVSVECDDKNLTFVLSVEYGTIGAPDLKQYGKMVELKSGDYCHWGFDEPERRDEVQGKPIYIDIVAKKGEKIAGYGVIMISDLVYWENRSKLLKFAMVSQEEREYQTVSENQVKKAMEEIKNS